MNEPTKQLELKRLLLTSVILLAPVALILSFLAIGATVPIILLIYVTVIVEGVALAFWMLSTISIDANPALEGGGETGHARKYNFYFGRNRAETLALCVRSARGRKEGYLRQHSRVEVARVLERILPQSSSSFLAQVNRPNLPQELDLVLHPDEGGAKKQKGKDSAHLDYLSSLEDLVAASEVNR